MKKRPPPDIVVHSLTLSKEAQQNISRFCAEILEQRILDENEIQTKGLLNLKSIFKD